MQLPFRLNAKHHILFQIHNTNIDDCVEARSNSRFIRQYDDVVEDHDNTTPIMLEMDDNNLCKSDNFDTQLSIKASCVLSRRSARATGQS